MKIAIAIVGVIACAALAISIYALVKKSKANKSNDEPLDCRHVASDFTCKPPFNCEYENRSGTFMCS